MKIAGKEVQQVGINIVRWDTDRDWELWSQDAYPDSVEGQAAPDVMKSAFVVQIETEDGEIYTHHHSFDDDKAAEAFADKVRAADREWDESHWSFERYVYGSTAYQQNYASAEGALMDDEERNFRGFG